MNKHIAEVSKDHNRPAILAPSDLIRDFAHIDAALTEIEADVKAVPSVIEDDEDLEIARSAVRRCQGAYKRLESVRVETKEPYLGASRVVDSHFNNRKEAIEKWQAGIEASAKRFLDKKAAEERAHREEEARLAAQEAARAAEDHRKAEEARIAREQARLAEEALADAHDGEHFNAIEESRQEETEARDRALAATAEALSKQKAAEAKPADLARTRTGDGLSTLEEVWKYEVINLKEALTDNMLLSFISTNEIDKAVARYVKVHKGDRPLKGVRIYSDTKPRMT